MRHLIASLLLASSAALPALADNTEPAWWDRIVTSITIADVEAMLEADGYTITERNPSEMFVVVAHKDDQLSVIFSGEACEPDGCFAVQVMVGMTTEQPVDLERVNQANMRWSAAKVAVDPRTSVDHFLVSRYLLLERGVSLANILTNVELTLLIAGHVAEFLDP